MAIWNITITPNEQNLKPAKSTNFLTHDKFLECDKQLYNEFVLLFHNSVYHILKTCHTSKNLWIIDNFAGFKFCSLRVSLAKGQWARLVHIYHPKCIHHLYIIAGFGCKIPYPNIPSIVSWNINHILVSSRSTPNHFSILMELK